MSADIDEVMKFLRRHENKDGKAGEFVRCCILLAERSESMTRQELKDSAQMGYLLDCFPTYQEDDSE